MRFGRRVIVGVLALGVMVGLAPPAGAATVDVEDDSGDVSDPAVDIELVSITHTATSIEVEITVDDPLPFSEPAWEAGMTVTAVLAGAADAEVAHVLSGGVFDGEPGAVMFGPASICGGSISQTATAYVLRSDGDCVRNLPRSVEVGVVVLGDDVDQAPDGESLSPAVAGPTGPVVTRLAGTDRVLTAIELSQDRFEGGEATGAVVASSANFPDALAGGPLAVNVGGPLLLTGAAGLDARVRTELVRALPPGTDVHVLGGTAALSDQVITDLRSAGFTPKRVAGTNRFETAVAIADESERLVGEQQAVLIADGRTFQDALIAASAAPAQLGSVVLTDGSTLPPATQTYLDSAGGDRIAVGATAAAAVPGTRSITADNPSALSVAVARELGYPQGLFAVASQSTYPDALAGGAFVGAYGVPLLLTAGESLSGATDSFLRSVASSAREVVIFGGTAAVSSQVEQAVRSAVGA